MVSRDTRQKKTIRDRVAKMDSFFTAEELFGMLDGISLATIYRYLKGAVKAGELFSYSCDGRRLYSVGRRSHCHYVCENTGKVIHFDISSLDFLKDKIPGSITSFQLEVRGMCDKCGLKQT